MKYLTSIVTLLCLVMCASAQTHKTYCLGSIFGIGRTIIVPTQQTDPQMLAGLATIQAQQAQLQQQMNQAAINAQLAQHAQQVWQGQQAQLQVMQAQQGALLQAINNGNINNQETKTILNQLIQNQNQLMRALEAPITVIPTTGGATTTIPSKSCPCTHGGGVCPCVPTVVPPSTTIPPPTTTPSMKMKSNSTYFRVVK